MRNKNRINLTLFSIVSILLVLSACETKTTDILKTNTLLQESNLPYNVPDFTKINQDDFLPAMEYGIEQKLAEIQQIAENTEEANFDNVFIALEKSGESLRKVRGVFEMLTGANTNATLQKAEVELAPKLSQLSDAIYLNDKLFNKVEVIYQKLDEIDLDAESNHLVEYYYKKFLKSGANLNEYEKQKLMAINAEAATLRTKFSNTLIAAAKNAAVVVDSKDELKGLSEDEITMAAKNATDKGLEGKYVLGISNTTQVSVLAKLENRSIREKLFKSSVTRAQKSDSNDTQAIITRIAELRAEKAEILGFDNYAAWNLQDQMAKKPEAVFNFFSKMVQASVNNAKVEADELQALIDREKGGFKLQAWDWNYYAEKLRKEKYDLNGDEIMPYFELFTVLEKGVFYTAEKLYGMTFKQRNDIPVYSDDMRVYELFNEDGSTIGLFYCDYFKRDNKSGGAWMSNIVEQSTLLGTKPVIYNVCNFTKPAEGKPALITYDNVTTLFHEFGHALHGFFASQKYVSLSGTSVARDFVELPSQFYEHWALYPAVFNNYAVHFETGEPMPESLFNKIKKASTFNQGYMLTELLAAANLDLQWHALKVGEKIESVDAFEEEALKKTGLYNEMIPPRYRSSYFLHIWGHGYAAGYYAYLWAEMLDADAFEWFIENGGLKRENGERFRQMILSRGNTQDFAEMYKAFAGREPNIEPMLKNRGLLAN